MGYQKQSAQHITRWLTPRLVALFCLMAVLLSSACGGGPPARLYLLDIPPLTANDASDVKSAIERLGISQVKVPGYASDARIASRQSDGVVRQIDDQRWAEEPEDAITRLLADRLRQRANATVLVEPWPRNYNPRARIEVMFDRLLREPGGGAHLTGQIHLLEGDGRTLLQSVSFDYKVPARTSDSVDFFKAVAIGVDEVAREALRALLSEGGLS